MKKKYIMCYNVEHVGVRIKYYQNINTLIIFMMHLLNGVSRWVQSIAPGVSGIPAMPWNTP